MKTNKIPFAFLFAASLSCFLALSARATWTYDSSAKTLTDGNWMFAVTASGDDLTLSKATAGSGVLDFTTCEADCGKRVTTVGGSLFYNNKSVTLTEFIGPDVTIVNTMAFFGTPATRIRLSSALQQLNGNDPVGGTTSLVEFYPTVMTNLTTVGGQTFEQFGKSTVTFDLEFPVLPAFGLRMFNNSRVSSVVAPQATVIPDGTFRSCVCLTNLVVSPKLASVGSDAFNGATSITSIDAGYCTKLSSYAFKGASALSNLVFRGTITSCGELVAFDLKPAANVVFYGEPPTLGSKAIFSSSDSAWARMWVVDGKSRQSWLDFVKPFEADFESFKSRADYPGEGTLGVYLCQDATRYNWVVDYPYSFRATGSDGEYAELSSAYDCVVGAKDGDVFEGEAPTDDIVISEDLSVAIRGWKLYEIAADGSATQVDESDENTYSIPYEAGKKLRLEWQTVRRWRLAVTAGPGGMVDVASSPFYADEGSLLTVTATPSSSDYSLKEWQGAPADATQEGNKLSFVVSGPATVTAVFQRAWAVTEGVLSDGVNWSLNVTELANGSLRIDSVAAGSGDLDLSNVARDVGKKVTVVANDVFRDPKPLTSFVGPDVTELGNYVFYGSRTVTNIVLSSALKSMGICAAAYTYNTANFYPTDMTNLTTYGSQALEGAFQSTTYAPTMKFPRLKSFKVFRSGIGCVIATNMTDITERAFWQCPRLTNVVVSANLKTIGTSAFEEAKALKSFDLGGYPQLTTIGASAFKKATALTGPMHLTAPGLTAVPASAFEGCSALSGVSLGAQITSVGDSAFAGLAPSADFYFFGNPPTMGSKAFYAQNGEAQDVRARMWVVGGAASEPWAELVAPNAETFEAYKSKPDYPGPRAFGLYQSAGTTEWNWVADCPYSLFITATHDECLGPSPSYGVSVGLEDGTVLEGSAPDGELVASDAMHYFFRGWKLYEVNDLGEETMVDSADTNAYSFVYASGKQMKLVWQVERRYKIDVAVGAGGSIDLTNPYVAEETDLTIIATPFDGYSFDGWKGTLPDGAVVDGNRITFTVTGPEAFSASFVRGWQYNASTGVLDDGLGWTLVAMEVEGGLCLTNRIAGSGDLDLSKVEHDTGYKVVAVGNGNRTIGNFLGSGLTSFYGPDVVKLAAWCFYGSAMTNCWVSDDIHTIGQDALGSTTKMQAFHPTCFRALKTTGSQAMESIGAGVPAHFNFEFPLVECFGVGGLFRVSMDSVVATNMTRLADRCFWDCKQLTNIVLGCCVTQMQYQAFRSLPKYKGPIVLDVTTVPYEAFAYSTALTSIVFRAQLDSIAGESGTNCGAIDHMGDDLEISFTGLPPTFGDNAIRSGSGKPIRLCVALKRSNRAAWQALAEPNDVLFRSEYVGRDDFPGTANGYNTIGIINTGTTAVPVYNWLIDTREHYGLSVIVR